MRCSRDLASNRSASCRGTTFFLQLHLPTLRAWTLAAHLPAPSHDATQALRRFCGSVSLPHCPQLPTLLILVSQRPPFASWFAHVVPFPSPLPPSFSSFPAFRPLVGGYELCPLGLRSRLTARLFVFLATCRFIRPLPCVVWRLHLRRVVCSHRPASASSPRSAAFLVNGRMVDSASGIEPPLSVHYGAAHGCCLRSAFPFSWPSSGFAL